MMINYWAVLVAAIASMVIGGIWWGPLFGKMWARENGFDQLSPEQQQAMKKGMTWSYLQQLILSFIEAWVIAYVLHKFNESGAVAGLCVGALLWLGFQFPLQYGQKLWSNKKFGIIFAMLANSLITLAVMGAIIGAWQMK